jgi:hypothetical protein
MTNEARYDFEKELDDFIALGAEVIGYDAAARYGYRFSNNTILQPGFITPWAAPKVVYIGINPSSNSNDRVAATEEASLYRRWAKLANRNSYRLAFDAWAQGNLRHWFPYKSISSILSENNLSSENGDLAWLNIAKVQTSASSEVTEDIVRTDAPLLERQLRMMGPNAFIILGTTARAFDGVRMYLESNYFPEQIAVVGQRASTLSRNAAGQKLRRWLNRPRSQNMLPQAELSRNSEQLTVALPLAAGETDVPINGRENKGLIRFIDSQMNVYWLAPDGKRYHIGEYERVRSLVTKQRKIEEVACILDDWIGAWEREGRPAGFTIRWTAGQEIPSLLRGQVLSSGCSIVYVNGIPIARVFKAGSNVALWRGLAK